MFDYRRFYNLVAPFYGPAMRVIPFWKGYTEQVLPWLPTPDDSHSFSVLELGPGPGVLLREIAARYPVAVGLDLAPGMLRQAQRRLRRAGLPVRLVEGNVLQLPFVDNCFDGIALTFVFSAIPDGAAAMRELARVLHPGGVIALVDACKPGDGNRIGTWLARQWERFGDFMRDEAALMRAADLEIVAQREFGAFNSIRITVGRKG